MQFTFLWIGETRNSAYLSAEDNYLGRIGHLVRCQRDFVEEQKKKDPRLRQSKLKREAELLDRKIQKGGYLIALDQKGQELSSRELADRLNNLMNQGISEIIFLVGGYGGIPVSIIQRSKMKLSLSRLTLPHELARVMLLEQVYRALTIIRGLPYHR